MKTEKSCDNCIYSIPDWTNVCNPDHYCNNQKSEEYGYNTEYLNGCNEWKSIEPNLGNNGSICIKTGGNDEDRTTDDCISRKRTIDALGYCQTYLFDSRDDDKKISLEDAKYAIEQLPSAQPETNEQEQLESAKEYCADCDHIEMCQWYPFEGCEFRSIPSAQPQWIPCSERLPDNEEDVLCDDDGRVTMGYYTDEMIGWHDMHSYKIFPTAWMPLPKSYGGE